MKDCTPKGTSITNNVADIACLKCAMDGGGGPDEHGKRMTEGYKPCTECGHYFCLYSGYGKRWFQHGEEETQEQVMAAEAFF